MLYDFEHFFIHLRRVGRIWMLRTQNNTTWFGTRVSPARFWAPVLRRLGPVARIDQTVPVSETVPERCYLCLNAFAGPVIRDGQFFRASSWQFSVCVRLSLARLTKVGMACRATSRQPR